MWQVVNTAKIIAINKYSFNCGLECGITRVLLYAEGQVEKNLPDM